MNRHKPCLTRALIHLAVVSTLYVPASGVSAKFLDIVRTSAASPTRAAWNESRTR
jgi:hypothetical protein